MPSLAQYAGQAVVFAVVAAATGYLAANPIWREIPADMAQIKLSLVHGAVRVEDCRRLTYEEITRLPPSERRANTCKRERIAIQVELSVDGTMIYAETLQPGGLSRDGPAQAYRKFVVPAGVHHIVARLRDSKRNEGYDYQKAEDVMLAPGRNLAVDFKTDAGGFLFR
jgi:hypothetical protein